MSQQRPVFFRVHSAGLDVASTRYRAMLPALGLIDLDIPCIVSDIRPPPELLRRCRALVLVKSFRGADLDIAFDAHRCGIPIVLDLCDHIFVPGYVGGFEALHEVTFATIARWSSAIVTTGPKLADVVRARAPEHVPVHVIPDPEETPALLARMRTLAQRPPWRATLRTLLSELVRRPGRFAQRFAQTPPRPSPTKAGMRTILWFGAHGADHSDFGMMSLKRQLPALETLAREYSFRLLIVSNSRAKFDAHFGALPFETAYAEWAATRIFDDIASADICLLPNAGDTFSLCKSANRAVLALSCGAAIVADDFPALADFRECVAIGDWEAGIRRYLSDEAARLADVARGRDIIAQKYAAEVVARQWGDLIDRVAPV